MHYILNGMVDGNERTRQVLAALAAAGIQPERMHVQIADDVHEHGADPVSSWSVLGGAFGLALGAALGWVAMSWSPLPWVGALWGGVVGAICGARSGSYSVPARLRPAPPTPGVALMELEVELLDRQEAEQAQSICAELQVQAVQLSGKP